MTTTTGLAASPPVGDRFARAIERVLIHEGGDADDPRDVGGRTRWGISQRTYPTLDITKLTRAEAIALYRRDFWLPLQGDALPPALAFQALDAAVNHGVGRTVRWLQRLVGVRVDGQLGPPHAGRDSGRRSARVDPALTRPAPGPLRRTRPLRGVRTRLDATHRREPAVCRARSRMNAPLDPAFEAAHDALFALFGEPAFVRRGRAAPKPVRVVITFGVRELGDYSQGVSRVTTVKFRNTEWTPRTGDWLQLPTTRLRIDRIVLDDGLVTEAVLLG
jgi:hypothetical protein